MVNESTTSIQLTTMKHSSDGRSLALWKEERQLKITSSNVGKIAKRWSTTKVGQLVHQLLYSTFKGNKATSWGQLQEEDTEIQYQQFMKQSCKIFSVSCDCGLAVSRLHPWVTATPDGFVNDPNAIHQNGLEEYKNPHTCRNSLIEEAITSKQIKFLTINNGKFTLKRSHHYHY